jgi:hypothetical protein
MPCKLSDDKKTVLVKRGDRWVKAPGGEHDTQAEALDHLRALEANVMHGRKAGKPVARKPKGGRRPRAKR